MGFDQKPSTWLGPGFGLASHVAGFNTNDASSNKLLTRIVDADADPTTGDIRKLAYALCHALQAAWDAQSAASALPGKMTIAVGNANGPAGQLRRTFTFTFLLDADTTAVADE